MFPEQYESRSRLAWVFGKCHGRVRFPAPPPSSYANCFRSGDAWWGVSRMSQNSGSDLGSSRPRSSRRTIDPSSAKADPTTSTTKLGDWANQEANRQACIIKEPREVATADRRERRSVEQPLVLEAPSGRAHIRDNAQRP